MIDDYFKTCKARSDEFIETMIKFLSDNPEMLGWRGKNNIPDLETKSGKAAVREKLNGYYEQFNSPSTPKTIDDSAVGKVLEYHYHNKDVARTLREHKEAMAAENFVGYLLEHYIFHTGLNHGWLLCPNSIVKHVDFIRLKPDNTWEMLQVKNRDNSENSSSKAIRNGKDIKHWFRSFSRKDSKNWAAFPDETLRASLSEAGFMAFIKEYLETPKN